MAYMKFYSGSYINYGKEANKNNSLYISNVNTTQDSTQNLLSFTTQDGTTIPLLVFPDIKSIGTKANDISVQSVSTTTERYYQIERATDGRLVVNVPWSNSVYTHPPYTSKNVGETTNRTITNGGTFKVIHLASDSTGHITNSTKEVTLTLPTYTDTWREVKVNGTSYVGLGPEVGSSPLNLTSGSVSGIAISVDTESNNSIVFSHAAPGIGGTSSIGEQNGQAGTYAANTDYNVVTNVHATKDSLGHITQLFFTRQHIKDTTYEPGSEDLLRTATSNTNYVWSPSVLNGWITDILGVDPKAAEAISYIGDALANNDKASGLINLINNKKDIQSAVSNPSTTSGYTISFISDITQDEQGVINPTKRIVSTVSPETPGLAPKGASVSTQSQSTKFLREDGTWAAPSYTTDTHRIIQVNGTQLLDNSTSNTKAINYKSGAFISLATASSGTTKTITINHGQAGSSSSSLSILGITPGEGGTIADITLKHGDTFKVPNISYDTYGHIVSSSSQTVTYTLPASGDTWRPISVNGTDFLTSAAGGSTGVTINYKAGESISLVTAAEGTNGTITIAHGNPTTAHLSLGADEVSDGQLNLSHGGTFKIPRISYDTNGHIVSSSSKTITCTLPASGDTWRPIKVNGTQFLTSATSGTNSGAVNLKSGTSITVSSGSSGQITIGHNIAPSTEAAAGTGGTAPVAVKVGRDATGHTVLGNELTATDITYGSISVADELSYLRAQVDALLDIVKYL